MNQRVAERPANSRRSIAIGRMCAVLLVALVCVGRAGAHGVDAQVGGARSVGARSIGARSIGAQEADSRRCADLAHSMQGRWPDSSTRIVSAVLRAEGPFTPPPQPGAPPSSASVLLPEHCEVFAVQHERLGAGGQHYSIEFHLRLPTRWNGRFLFQGGGGSNGVVGDALGPTAVNTPPAIVRGFAVVSQDSGHDNSINTDPARGGQTAFGFDPRARADYGHASLQVVADAAKALITGYYGKKPQYSYFVGCSKGGQEGMVFAQRYPEEFDGVIAAAPGFSLPRAAVAEASDVQAIAAVVRAPEARTVPIQRFAAAFSNSDLVLVRDSILAVCDADDGVKDGIVGAFTQCTNDKVLPALESRICEGEKSATCLSRQQVTALERIYAGPHDSAGKALYSDWQWDAGIASFGWRLWKLGSADGKIPALNVALGGASLAAVFTTPPTAVANDLGAALDFQLGFDLDRDAAKIYATDANFVNSAWTDIAARSGDLHLFRAHRGKLIVPHGVSDPVFSINDTLAWYHEVDQRNHGHADRFVRVFPVPGMGHCGGGPATDGYDAFTALTDWVERGHAPDRIVASAGPDSPWPGRTRPLCAYPKTAHYNGSGNIEAAENFTCR